MRRRLINLLLSLIAGLVGLMTWQSLLAICPPSTVCPHLRQDVFQERSGREPLAQQILLIVVNTGCRSLPTLEDRKSAAATVFVSKKPLREATKATFAHQMERALKLLFLVLEVLVSLVSKGRQKASAPIPIK